MKCGTHLNCLGPNPVDQALLKEITASELLAVKEDAVRIRRTVQGFKACFLGVRIRAEW